MGIDNSGPIQSFNEEIEQNKKSNLNSNNSKKNNNNNNININLNSSYSGFCGNFSSNDIINNKKKTEIDLTTTFSSAKGTYTKESYKLFSQNEKNFFYLVQKNNITGIRYLIIHGVNINILDEERTSPLHIACKESSIQTIEEIIFQGSMINIPDLVGWTPLHMACYYNRPDVVLLLLKSGANYNTHNRDKLSARDLAIKCGNYNCAKVLDNFIYYQKIEKEKCLNEINVRNLKNGKNLENMKNEENMNINTPTPNYSYQTANTSNINNMANNININVTNNNYNNNYSNNYNNNNNNVPQVSSSVNTGNIMVVSGRGPGIPPPPPPPPPPPVVPVIKTVPKKPAKAEVEGGNQIIEEPKKELSMAEQLATIKLKKVGTVKAKEVNPKKPPVVNHFDLLRQQIMMRFQKLKQHEDKNEEDEEEEEF